MSARGEAHWIDVVERDRDRLRTEATCKMRLDETDFHLSARMEAWGDDRLVFERDLTERVPRDHR